MTRLFGRHRSFRILNIAALAVLMALMLGVYWAKTGAAADAAAITAIERQIVQEKNQIRILQAEVARLETPERISRLSEEYLGMGPILASHETRVGELQRLAGYEPPAEPALPPPLISLFEPPVIVAQAQDPAAPVAPLPPPPAPGVPFTAPGAPGQVAQADPGFVLYPVDPAPRLPRAASMTIEPLADLEAGR
jgi:cell division protein FtsL